MCCMRLYFDNGCNFLHNTSLLHCRIVNFWYFLQFCNSSFNNNIGTWNVKNVKTMECMFCGATEFNQDISRWRPANLENANYMFDNATKFNSALSEWVGK